MLKYKRGRTREKGTPFCYSRHFKKNMIKWQKYNKKVEEARKMKNLKIIIIILLIIIGIALAIASYFLFIDIQSKLPKNLKSDYQIEIKKYSDRNVFIINQKDKQNQKHIIYLHGGSYVGGIEEYHWKFIEDIIQDTEYSVIVPDYPLAPKYTYKEVFEMIVPLYTDIIQEINPENLILMGDSAGGGIALALEQRVGELGLEMPEQLLLISPWLDTTMSNPKIDEVQKLDKELNKETLKAAGMAYARRDNLEDHFGDGAKNYLVNPIDGPVKNLKNVTIFTGTHDILNPDVHVFVDKAKQQGIEINVEEYEGAGHIWIVDENRNEGKAKEAYEQLVEKMAKST